MKPFSKIIRVSLCLIILGFAISSMAAPSLTVTPAAFTNDYVGTVSLSITGLVAGSTIRIERFFDANSNGIVDVGDLMSQSYTVTDGQVPLIGGVRNINVPGDDDGLTNGQIRVDLTYPGAATPIDLFAGNYLLRVSDPASGFTPFTQAYAIKQKTYPQGVTGQATAAGTGLPLSHARVVLGDQSGNVFDGTIADDNGNYTLYSPAGNFGVFCVVPGFVADQNVAGVTVTSNVFAVKNITNAAATTTVSGNITDSSTSIGLPGVMIQAETTNSLFALSFTDTNGNYSLPLSAAQWKVKLSAEFGTLLGYVRQNSSIKVNTTTGSVANVNFQLTKAAALVYGSIKDSQTNPVPILIMYGQDQGNVFDAKGQSDVHGNYAVGVLGSSALNIGPDNGSLALLGFIGQGATVAITNGQAILQNFVVQHITAHLRGHVIDGNSNAVPNVTMAVFPFLTNGTSAISLNPTTAGDGSFDVGVFGGSWNVDLETGSADSLGLVGPNLIFSVTDGVDQNNIIVMAQNATAQISGTVKDTNGVPVVGVRPSGNVTVNGVNYFGSGSTDTNGFYQFNVFPGSWSVGIQDTDMTARGFQPVGNQGAIITGTNNQVVNFVALTSANTPPALGQMAFAGGHFQFQVNGLSGRNYRIEGTTNLTGPWIPLLTNTAFGGSFSFSDTNVPPFPRRFYRALLLP
ncbi:MAG: regulator of chromosome condensation [Pedosphaera sp.]|nr:regulator of chromosome condensation [Pedosphaera sp.]